MKTLASIILSCLIFFSMMTSYGFNKSSLQDPAIRKAVITNLLIGLNSNNFGLKTSSAFMLGEIKANEAVIPLMKMLRREKNEDARIVAALALYKINDSRGIFAVKQAIRFDTSDRVKRMCTNYYNQNLIDRLKLTGLDTSSVALK